MQRLTRRRALAKGALTLSALALAACRGQLSSKPQFLMFHVEAGW